VLLASMFAHSDAESEKEKVDYYTAVEARLECSTRLSGHLVTVLQIPARTLQLKDTRN
jgi:hypothetical protein